MMMNQYPDLTDYRPGLGRRFVAGTMLAVIAIAGVSACGNVANSKTSKVEQRVSDDYLGHVDPGVKFRTSAQVINAREGMDGNDCSLVDETVDYRSEGVEVVASDEPNDPNVDEGWIAIPVKGIQNADVVADCSPLTDTVYVSDRYAKLRAHIIVE